MKYLLVAIVVIGISYIGYGISKYYRKRKRFFEDLILLSERLSVDISFSKDNLRTIINNSMSSYGNDLKGILNIYTEYLKNNQAELTNQIVFKKTSLIKEDEKEIVFLFFQNLGRLDASNQISEINNFKTKFIALKDLAVEDNKKLGSLSFKLAILFALLIVILLI